MVSVRTTKKCHKEISMTKSFSQSKCFNLTLENEKHRACRVLQQPGTRIGTKPRFHMIERSKELKTALSEQQVIWSAQHH